MRDLRPVIFIEGVFVLFVSLLMLAPALIDGLAGNPDWKVFLISAGVALAIGGLMVTSAGGGQIDLDIRQGFFLTTTSWILVSAIAAIPFVFANLRLGYTDAFFEAMSGLTTTGSTVLSGLDHMPPGLLLWRSMLQWVGGIGIIVTAVALLPFLRVGGMQLFRMESSDTTEKILPRAGQIAGAISLIYLLLTILCAVMYDLAGMTPFEAINHAMTTISTGGFSTSDASMGHFNSLTIQWISVLFMLLGSLPFALYVRALKGGWRDLAENSQVRVFLIFLVLVTAGLSCWVWRVDGLAIPDAVTLVAFNVVSVVTTTGFASTDYTLWGTLPVITFLILTFVGGCTGSTSGAIKIFRFEMMYRIVRRQLHIMMSPSDVRILTYGSRELPDDVIRSVGVFVFQFAFITVLLSLMLSLTGLDLVTSFTGAATAIANVGPGLGDIIGPSGNFASLPDSAKWILSAGMLIGRLEILTVLVLLSPAFWRP
ncbi:potassium transporter TrkH [Alphaproteobacteria bacterium HT1-32]|nr:potassium transporter TrkH [Alphaproteobacteria bacterium HT1-32]